METADVVLLLRVVLSLSVVVALVWVLGRRMAGTQAVRRRRADAVTVVGRQSLGGKASVAVVDVAGRRLVLGVGEHGVRLLTEVDVPAPEPTGTPEVRLPVDDEELAALERSLAAVDSSLADPTLARPTHPTPPAARTPAVPTPRHPLEGSILDAAVWRQAVVAVQERTIRR